MVDVSSRNRWKAIVKEAKAHKRAVTSVKKKKKTFTHLDCRIIFHAHYSLELFFGGIF